MSALSVFGHRFRVWLTLQSGQERIIRWSRFLAKFPFLRKQTGHDHRCSIYFLCSSHLVLIRDYVHLDEALILDCCSVHDEAEGLLMVDVPANIKKDTDDLAEYLAFRDMYHPLGPKIWRAKQMSFLLQTCVNNPECFDNDAREVMSMLAKTKRFEALFFKGIEMLDYLYYAVEGSDAGAHGLVQEVATHHVHKLDEIAEEVPGFERVVWTPELREHFMGVVSEHEQPRLAFG